MENAFQTSSIGKDFKQIIYVGKSVLYYPTITWISIN